MTRSRGGYYKLDGVSHYLRRSESDTCIYLIIRHGNVHRYTLALYTDTSTTVGTASETLTTYISFGYFIIKSVVLGQTFCP